MKKAYVAFVLPIKLLINALKNKKKCKETIAIYEEARNERIKY